jgi:sugar lactone lactonase YvrE
MEQRQGLERARSAGMWQAYLSANAAYWRVRVEAGPDGPFRRITCFKDNPDPVGGAASTVRFRDRPLDLPENALLGAMYEAWHPVSIPLVVSQASHWLFSGTGLRDGDALAQVVGYEADRLFDNGRTPPGTQALAEAPVVDVYGRPSWHQLALHTWSSGAQVLAAGSIEWSWALSVPGVADARVQRITANFLERAGAAPLTPGASFGAANAWARADHAGSTAAVVTVAGVPGVRGGADGAAGVATLDRPSGLAAAADGTLYLADAARHTVRRLSSGTLSTLAGGGRGCVDGTGATARFDTPTGTAVGADGSVYVADTGNHCIRRVTPAGQVTTLAGRCGWVGFQDGGAAGALFSSPQGLAVTADGTLLVADSGNNALRRVRAGQVSTWAASPGGAGDRSVFFFPTAVVAAPDGSAYVVDSGHRAVKRVAPAGSVSEVLAQFPSMGRYTLVQDWGGGGFDDGPLSRALGLPAGGIALVGRTLYLSDAGNNRLRRIDLDAGQVTTFAGTGRGRCEDGAGATAGFSYPQGLAVVGRALFVADSCGAVRRVQLP